VPTAQEDKPLAILYPLPHGGPRKRPVPDHFFAIGSLSKEIKADRIVATLKIKSRSYTRELTRDAFRRHPRRPERWLWAVLFRELCEVDFAELTVTAYQKERAVVSETIDFPLGKKLAPGIEYPEPGQPLTSDDRAYLPCWGDFTAPDDVYLVTLTYGPESPTTEGYSETYGFWWSMFFDLPNPPTPSTVGSIVASGSGVPSAPRTVSVS
jgi:hypothetical protein